MMTNQYINDTSYCVCALKSRHHCHMNIIYIFECIRVSVCVHVHIHTHTYIFLSHISAHFMIKVFWDAMSCSTSQSGCGGEEKKSLPLARNKYQLSSLQPNCYTELPEIMTTRPRIWNDIEIVQNRQ